MFGNQLDGLLQSILIAFLNTRVVSTTISKYFIPDDHFSCASGQQRIKFRVIFGLKDLSHQSEKNLQNVFRICTFDDQQRDLINTFHKLCALFQIHFAKIDQEIA